MVSVYSKPSSQHLEPVHKDLVGRLMSFAVLLRPPWQTLRQCYFSLTSLKVFCLLLQCLATRRWQPRRCAR